MPALYRRVGGLRFLRIGRLQLSWCVCRSAGVRQPARWVVVADVHLVALLVVLQLWWVA